MSDDSQRFTPGWRDVGAGYLLFAIVLAGLTAFGGEGATRDAHADYAYRAPMTASDPQAGEADLDDEPAGLLDEMPDDWNLRSRLYCRGDHPVLLRPS